MEEFPFTLLTGPTQNVDRLARPPTANRPVPVIKFAESFGTFFLVYLMELKSASHVYFDRSPFARSFLISRFYRLYNRVFDVGWRRFITLCQLTPH